MRKRNIIGALLCSVCLIAANGVPAMADAVKVVTLGADLTEDQKNTMMRYFQVDANQVQILTITNQDERDHLSAYVPLEQIGTRTVSCAYVKPTSSGGIKVRTANLNWVTCNMIATTLSTSGVSNCEVVAACPFEVSGTGALTGILMAYETASGEQLDETKKEIATEELVVTGNLAQDVGQDDATYIVNEAKKQVVQNNIQNADEIYNVVVNIAEQNNMQVDSAQLDKIVSLLEQIAQQNYNYDDMKETLENVEENVSGEAEIGNDGAEETENTEEEAPAEDPDSIVSGLDESILGSDVIASSTEDPTLEEETRQEAETAEGTTEIPEASADGTQEGTENIEGTTEIPEASADGTQEGTENIEGTTEIPEASADGTQEGAEEIVETPAEGTEEETVDITLLDEEAKALYDQAAVFCAGEYEGDTASLQTAMGTDAAAAVVLDTETGSQLTDKVLNIYAELLLEGTDSYVPADTDVYLTTELNMLSPKLKTLFGLAEDGTEADEILANVSAEDRQTLYEDTMKFFEKLYGETTETLDTQADASGEGMAAAEEVPVQ